MLNVLYETSVVNFDLSILEVTIYFFAMFKGLAKPSALVSYAFTAPINILASIIKGILFSSSEIQKLTSSSCLNILPF